MGFFFLSFEQIEKKLFFYFPSYEKEKANFYIYENAKNSRKGVGENLKNSR